MTTAIHRACQQIKAIVTSKACIALAERLIATSALA
jgi:hypothetical protein